MKALVLFDSYFGNTQKIAETLAAGLGEETRAISADEFKESDLARLDLLIVGSPIIGWKPSEKIAKILAAWGEGRLQGLKAAAFDTRVKLFIHGDAGKGISRILKNAGAELIAGPQAFFVRAKEGPLFEGEIEKAAAWAMTIRSKI